jgi:hypothetical protein
MWCAKLRSCRIWYTLGINIHHHHHTQSPLPPSENQSADAASRGVLGERILNVRLCSPLHPPNTTLYSITLPSLLCHTHSFCAPFSTLLIMESNPNTPTGQQLHQQPDPGAIQPPGRMPRHSQPPASSLNTFIFNVPVHNFTIRTLPMQNTSKTDVFNYMAFDQNTDFEMHRARSVLLSKQGEGSGANGALKAQVARMAEELRQLQAAICQLAGQLPPAPAGQDFPTIVGRDVPATAGQNV